MGWKIGHQNFVNSQNAKINWYALFQDQYEVKIA